MDEDVEENMDDDGGEIELSSGEEIAEQIKPWLDEVDADYDAQLEQFVKAFEKRKSSETNDPA